MNGEEKVDTRSTGTDTAVAASVATSGIGMSAVAMLDFAKVVGTQRVEGLVVELTERMKAVSAGKMGGVEAMLMGPAIALQSIFANFAHRSALNAGQILQATETYMKLVLRAQSQSRSTLETLALIKYAPRVYAQEDNVTTGPQQINTVISRDIESEQTQLLEAQRGKRLNIGTKGQAGRVDPRMETVGAVNRTENRRG